MTSLNIKNYKVVKQLTPEYVSKYGDFTSAPEWVVKVYDGYRKAVGYDTDNLTIVHDHSVNDASLIN